MKYIVTLGAHRYEVMVEEGEAMLAGMTVVTAPAAPAASAAPAAPVAAAPAAPAASASGDLIHHVKDKHHRHMHLDEL